MKYFDEARSLWQQYVPKAGQADSVQGELFRAVEQLRSEAQSNGNTHWDEGHDILASFLLDVLTQPGFFDETVKAQIQADVARIQDHKTPYVEDDLYDRLSDRAVEWSRRHPAPVAHARNPKLKH